MANIDTNSDKKISQVPIEVQLQLCKEVAIAFGYLCKIVCEKFGQEGVKVIEENFLSDSDLFNGDTPRIEEVPSKEVSMTLIKLLASWGVNKVSCSGEKQ